MPWEEKIAYVKFKGLSLELRPHDLGYDRAQRGRM